MSSSPSAVCQAHFEAQAALGSYAYSRDRRGRLAYVNWTLACKRAAEDARAARRHARSERWRLIAAGVLEPMAGWWDASHAQRFSDVETPSLADAYGRVNVSRPVRETVPAGEAEGGLTIAGGAARLGISSETLRQRINRGAVLASPKRPGQPILIPASEVERLLAVSS